MTTFTWNINHAQLTVVEERCVYGMNSENRGWTEIRQEAGAVWEFGLTLFPSTLTKTVKGFEYILTKLQGEAPSKTLVENAKEAKGWQRRRPRTLPARRPASSSDSRPWCGQTIREKRIVEAANKREVDYEVGDIPTEWE
ncbi:hypothetical protein GH733_009742, partial [Mirounga leonina]